jgi:hypothetical protein
VHYTRMLMGGGGLLMAGSLFLPALHDPSPVGRRGAGAPLYQWFGDSGAHFLYPYALPLDTWMLLALLGCASGLIVAAVAGDLAVLLARPVAVVVSLIAVGGVVIGWEVFRSIDAVAGRIAFASPGLGAYGVAVAGWLAVMGAGRQFAKPKPPGDRAD